MVSLNQSLLKPYLDSILAERNWSWSFAAIIYLLSAMVIRSWFLGSFSSRTRGLDKKVKRVLKKAYLQRSLLGWIFFSIPALIFIFLWQDQPLPPRVDRLHLIYAGAAAYAISIILHMRAFGSAAMITLRRVSETEQQKKFLEG